MKKGLWNQTQCRSCCLKGICSLQSVPPVRRRNTRTVLPHHRRCNLRPYLTWKAVLPQEHHLQRAICAQQVFREKKDSMVIPVPEAQGSITYYDRLYKGDFRQPKQLIHIQRESPVLCSFMHFFNWEQNVTGDMFWGLFVPCACVMNLSLVWSHLMVGYLLLLLLCLPAFGLDSEQPDYDMDSEDETLLNRLNRKMELKPLQFEIVVDRLEKASANQVTKPTLYSTFYTLCCASCTKKWPLLNDILK